MDKGNPETGGERLDRIERALNLMLDDHIKFREEQKWLLSAQVQVQGGLEELRVEVHKITLEVHKVTLEVNKVTRDIAALTSNVEATNRNIETMREHFDARLRRLEDQ